MLCLYHSLIQTEYVPLLLKILLLPVSTITTELV